MQLIFKPRVSHFEMTKSTEKNNQDDKVDLSAAVEFDPLEFEKRLAEVRQDFNNELKQSVLYKEPQTGEVPLNFNIPDAVVETHKKEIKAEMETPQQSGLLASLALEAKQSEQNRQSVDQDKQAKSRCVHDALDRVLKFFVPFVQHVNALDPAINRTYRLDARSVFTNLKWQGAQVDSRKQNMNDAALLNHVAFSVNLLAPEPVLLKRPWGQFEAVKKELLHLKIRTLDDLDVIHKKPKQEWLETHLDPALPVQIVFRGNYDLGKIDILTRNLADFGQAAFRLAPEDISATLLDELGLFLICRTDQPPVLLRASDR
jgi:hypothetical protein